MSQYGACPYRFAVNRVQHARAELAPEGRAAAERLLLALVALAPLVRGDLPTSTRSTIASNDSSAASTGHSTARPEAWNPAFGRCPT